MILSTDNARRIAEENSKAIGRDVNVMDENGVILASTDPQRVGTVHEGARRLLSEGLDMLRVDRGEQLPGAQEGVNLPVTLRGEVVGVIGISGPPDEVEVFGGIIRRMTEIQLEQLARQEQEEQLQQARDLFWEYLLFSEAVDPAEAGMRGALLGVDPALTRTAVELCLLQPDGAAPASELESTQLLSFLRRQLSGDAQAFCTVVHRRVLLFLPGGENEAMETVRALEEKLRYRFPLRLYGGISAPSHGAQGLRRCGQQAKTACKTALLSPKPRIVRYRDVSLDTILESVPEELRRQTTEKVFGACTREEREELLETLRVWFRCGGSTERAAQRLCVHKNTVLYRMEKLHKKTGYSLRDPQQSALLYCCMRFAEE